MRISGGRPRVGRPDDRTARSSAPLHAARRTEGLGKRKRKGAGKRLNVEKLCPPLFFSSDALQSGRLLRALTRTVRVRATVVSFTPVAHGRLAVDTTSAVAEAGEVNILFVEMNVPKMQQATCAPTSSSMGRPYRNAK